LPVLYNLLLAKFHDRLGDDKLAKSYFRKAKKLSLTSDNEARLFSRITTNPAHLIYLGLSHRDSLKITFEDSVNHTVRDFIILRKIDKEREKDELGKYV